MGKKTIPVFDKFFIKFILDVEIINCDLFWNDTTRIGPKYDWIQDTLHILLECQIPSLSNPDTKIIVAWYGMTQELDQHQQNAKCQPRFFVTHERMMKLYGIHQLGNHTAEF